MNNRVLISDNQRMYHRVEAIGNCSAPSPEFHDPRTVMVPDGSAWKIIEEGAAHRLPRGQIRISILWKAFMFQNAVVERIYDEHLDDLDLETAIGILREDALRREIRLPEPGDLHVDMSYRESLERAFPSTSQFAGLANGEAEGADYVA